ncbi:unnamed protein product [Protopolystoma xenopodis]|uniref:Secreted protein n=1 Tax=Protopolystoma xenopodis TaxID=117903 RepID=A0A448WGU3_9PLAT|nr:unnamed protein product [Protopolystoma xenopodis]
MVRLPLWLLLSSAESSARTTLIALPALSDHTSSLELSLACTLLSPPRLSPPSDCSPRNPATPKPTSRTGFHCVSPGYEGYRWAFANTHFWDAIYY